MVIDDNGPESAYPGPAEPGSGEDVYPEDEQDQEGNQSDVPDISESLPVDEAEEPSAVNSI
ncbi:hypothetical protein QN366_01505 [Pseudomonas sp. CCC3.2]|uniref:hypothetical protein n=1 Tax=unclassified Pseudomonas TaxID=196821 RepID=UPI002AB44EB8|nr:MULTISPECIES: hypothetical protein [unclassified Pseudomonas]MDY7560197.1 hypothetical protein [Pseudomonas sp. AB6]MEB0178746.1 hypothetical protein [Pseudomonas sp. CCC3.2]MEB0211384.1 hypothetical protein [Pseudomonas sp. AB6]